MSLVWLSHRPFGRASVELEATKSHFALPKLVAPNAEETETAFERNSMLRGFPVGNIVLLRGSSPKLKAILSEVAEEYSSVGGASGLIVPRQLDTRLACVLSAGLPEKYEMVVSTVWDDSLLASW